MKRRIIRNAMAVFVVLTMLISVASAADAVVSIGNASVNKTGDTAIVKIKIDDVSNMGSANIVLKYNNNIVMVDNVSEGDLGELALNISNAEGTTTIQWTGFEGKNGSFELAHVTLKANGTEGQVSNLELDVTLTTPVPPFPEPINANVKNGKFSIGETGPDNIAPVTTIIGVTENGSYNNTVTVTLDATDNPGGTGVNKKLYMVNGGQITTYLAPFDVNIIGQDSVTYWSTDNAGNVEAKKMVNFTIVSNDTTPPVTTISGVTENGSYNNNVIVTLDATDNESGVNETFYMVNGSQTTPYSVPFVVNTNGSNNVTYWSIDKAGNKEAHKMVNFTISGIDNDSPSTTISGVTENGSYNNNVTVILNAMDNPGGSCGVNETFYMVNGGTTMTYSVPFVVDTIGPDNVTYWSTDKARNVEAQKMVNFTIVNVTVNDTEPPVTTISGVTENDSFDITENGSYNNSVDVILTATDNQGGSGVDKTFYIVNGGQTTTYLALFVVNISGPNSVTYWSTDNVGNEEIPHKMVNFTIVNVTVNDTEPPVTTISGVIENGSYNNSVTVTLSATDNPGGSGVNETFYMVNGGTTTTYSVPFVVDTIGPDNVTYWSTDKARNVEAQKMVNFTVTPVKNATATREIKSKSILPGESTIITVSISGKTNALSLHEIPPVGWNVTRGTDNADAFKNSTNEWVWKSMETNTTVIYTLTAPVNISIGTYQIEGTIMNANGTLANVGGDNSIKIDILEFYRRLGNDPGVVETTDLLRAFDDFRNNIVPQGFNRPLSAGEVDELVNEWRNS